MINQDDLQKIRDALLECNKSFNREILFPTMIPEAALLIATDPYAFLIAACLDRGTLADIIWTIPYDMKRKLGHLDPFLINKMSLEELADLIEKLEWKPRYTNDAPRTIKDLTRIVCEECGGDASLIWKGKRATEVKRTLLRIHGVGEGIANMTVLLIEEAFSIRFNDLDRPNMDIKPDVHTMRVLYRLGVNPEVSPQSAIKAARLLNPEFPGALDGVLWWIGRKYCHSSNPACDECCVDKVCQKNID
jgi:endonuclease III